MYKRIKLCYHYANSGGKRKEKRYHHQVKNVSFYLPNYAIQRTTVLQIYKYEFLDANVIHCIANIIHQIADVIPQALMQGIRRFPMPHLQSQPPLTEKICPFTSKGSTGNSTRNYWFLEENNQHMTINIVFKRFLTTFVNIMQDMIFVLYNLLL